MTKPAPPAGESSPVVQPYSAAITVLRELAEVRKRPSMYVGDTGPEGQLHLVYEVLANAIDLHLIGRCQVIEVTVRPDGAVCIRDDGPGIPVSDDAGRPLLLLALIELHNAPTKDGHPVHVHLAAYGLGLSVVHALSDRIQITTAWQGRRWVVSGGAGKLGGPPHDDGPTDDGGTTVEFRPDPTIFPGVVLDAASLMARIQEVVALCPGLTIRFSDERMLEFRADDGLVRLLGAPPPVPRWRDRHMAPWRPAVPLAGHATGEGMSVTLCLQWALDGEPRIRSFVNLAETVGGGTHVSGLERGLGALGRMLRLAGPDEVAQTLARYVVAVICVFHFKPTFAGPTRDRLASPEIEPLVAGAAESCLLEFAATRPDEARALVEWVLERDRRGW